ncbi:MAG: T9SS type A sorting domain-containing protein [Bacteroidota bacterium]|nr:T9SS type A sorting domain-containing protein [Bacteroidota bacterium]
MKKYLLFIVAVFASTALIAQSVTRNIVVMEIGTATWCTYCPGSALAVEQMTTEGRSIGVIDYHSSDSYTNSASTARLSYYGMSGIPDAVFDGMNASEGGYSCGTGTCYSDYMAKYNSRLSVPSPLTIGIDGTNSGSTYNIILSLHKVGTINSSSLKAHLVLTESHINQSWQSCMTELNFVERMMVPDQNGTNISFASSDMIFVPLTFTKNSSWVNSNCQLVAFVQDDNTKEIFQGAVIDLNSLQPPITVDFSGTPTSGCSPVTVNYTSNAPQANAYQWDFPGGTPSSSTVANPTVTYNTSGTNDVTLTAWNTSSGRGNVITKTGYVTINSAPAAPTQPYGNNTLCMDPANQSYFTTTVTGASSYTWELSPSNAGTISPSSTTCVVDFASTFQGVATLRVKATSSCGDGPWSPTLTITLSQAPGISGTPTGPTQLCMNPSNSDYITTGTSPATSYTWELDPASAGALYPNYTTCTVDWVDDFTGTAQLKVKATNNGCDGDWSTPLPITVDGGPIAFTMTGGGAYCAVGGTGSAVGLSGSQTNVNYTLYLDNAPTSTVVAGTGTAISFGNQLTAGTYTCVAENAGSCTSTQQGEAVVTVDPQVPAIPGTPVGPDVVYSGSTPTSDYLTTGAQYASSYSWSISPANAGNVTGSSTTGTVTWNQNYSGTATVTVAGVNTCGSGTISQSYSITVGMGLGIANPTKQNLITVYPNPSTDFVNIIPSHELKANIRVYNAMGSMVLDLGTMTLKNTYRMNTSGLVTGVYFINLTGENFQEIRKIVVE